MIRGLAHVPDRLIAALPRIIQPLRTSLSTGNIAVEKRVLECFQVHIPCHLCEVLRSCFSLSLCCIEIDTILLDSPSLFCLTPSFPPPRVRCRY
jgi:hypothetical protein